MWPFGKNKNTETEAKVDSSLNQEKIQVIEKPVPHPVKVDTAPEELENYKKIAEEVNFYPGDLRSRVFREWLNKQGICMYNHNTVNKFLDDKFKNTGWEWVALRDEDVKKNLNLNLGHQWYENGYGVLRTGGANLNSKTYQKLIPFEVLKTVKKISDEFPNLAFYVSDASIPRADPFLLVTALGMEFFVIECWDEPGFKK